MERFAQAVDSDTLLSIALKGRRNSAAPTGQASIEVSGSTGYAKLSTRGYMSCPLPGSNGTSLSGSLGDTRVLVAGFGHVFAVFGPSFPHAGFDAVGSLVHDLRTDSFEHRGQCSLA